MAKVLRIVAALVAITMITGTAIAQGPVSPQHSAPAWDAAYWNNTTLSGSAVLQRTESNIDYNWGLGSPDPSVPADGFSARWSRYLDLTAGTYRFTTTSDDGIRVYVNGELVLNDWSDHSARTVTVDKYLSSGHHLVIVEYYERTVDAVARFSVALAPATITNWKGEYFPNTNLSGSPTLVRDDAQINFDWGWGSPGSGIGADYFSVRWTRNLSLAAGNYRFTLTVDDGARLYVNNHLLIDTWKIQAAHTYTGDIYLPGGSIPVKLEYFDNTERAVVKLSWVTSGGTAPPPAGTVIVDNGGTGFSKGGSPTSWRTAYEGYNGSLLWTKNNDAIRANYNWARWYPALSARRYEVFVYIPYRYTTTEKARYWISHADGYTLKVVNQSANGDRWVSLGTYRFTGTSNDYVSLSDVTYEAYLSRLIAFDAVKWEPR